MTNESIKLTDWPAFEYQRVDIDTIWLWVMDPLNAGHELEIRRTGAKCHRIRGPLPYDRRFKQRVVINQPTDDTLELLKELLGDRYFINHVAVAIDFVFNDAGKSVEFEECMKHHLYLKWSTKYRPKCFKDTTYWKEKRRTWHPRTAVLYIDWMRRKGPSGHDVHLEFRLSKSQTLKRYGLSRLEDLTMAKCRSLLDSQMSLAAIDTEKLGREHWNHFFGTKVKRRSPATRRAFRGRVENRDLRRGSVLERAAQVEGFPLGAVQTVKTMKHPKPTRKSHASNDGKPFRPRSSVTRMDHSFLLAGLGPLQ